ncbi:MAG: hypothetical protein LLG00_09230 [Planctomycetaceae bacterium]|nr:hypothetical protein [Planctomycetaceae bacterium]
MPRCLLPLVSLAIVALAVASLQGKDSQRTAQFVNPPADARPWVYWLVMDGNFTRQGITADLEAMSRVGIGGAIFLEVDLGIPRGPVRFMSKAWQDLFRHAVREAERLGLQISLAAGPGWCGTGGPWVKPEQSMQHLVASETAVSGATQFDAILPRPKPREPFFGRATLTPELAKAWTDFYRDVAVLAFPTPKGSNRIADIDEKALYHRAPYSSQPGVRPFLLPTGDHATAPSDQCVSIDRVIDLTAKLGKDGRLKWDVPRGQWTILRLGRTATAQVTRPAPLPGLGFETDKFSPAALDAHLNAYIEPLLKAIGPTTRPGCGLTGLHFDSWEMSSQNWSEQFRAEFRSRRGYDPLPYLPAMVGHVVASNEISERFLWDIRRTAQELVVEKHIVRLKDFAHRHGLQLSIEPYDMNPAGDLTLGGPADVPMGEFWAQGRGFDTNYSCIEAVSIAHTGGRPIVGAESFTAGDNEAWQLHPAAMKPQADWALCAGINRIVFHRYQHQPWLDRRPGMTMAYYGVHWERTQTWWDMSPAFHTYLARCQYMLRRGLPVADILYLAPEGAPHVFRSPQSATRGNPPDRLGYNFDGCAPETLIERATAKDGQLFLPDGMTYRLLVLPACDTMTPTLLHKITALADGGVTIVGRPPRRSPSLSDYPKCDEIVKKLADALWAKGRILVPPPPKDRASPFDIYPEYHVPADALTRLNVPPDFEADKPLRYIHRRDNDTDIYFVTNGTNATVDAACTFRVSGKLPEIWDPLTGQIRNTSAFSQQHGRTTVPLRFNPTGSMFIVFRTPTGQTQSVGRNFIDYEPLQEIAGPWTVAFDPALGGPSSTEFDKLVDWTHRDEPGIRYYSGKAVYKKAFTIDERSKGRRLFLNLGDVKDLVDVRLNGRAVAVLWCPPWRVEITNIACPGDNELQLTVANQWVNRLIGDASLPPEKRVTWTTWNPYTAKSPLLPSGLLGPVRIEYAK